MQLLLSVAALITGAVLGCFVLDVPIVPVAAESVIRGLAPYLRDLDAWLYARRAEYFLAAALIFIACIPNVTVLAAVVALAMKLFRRPRAVFYATLAWPLFHFAFEFDKVVRIMARLERVGRTPDLDSVLRAENIPTKAVGMLLVYTLFALLVYAFFRRFEAPRKTPPLSADASKN